MTGATLKRLRVEAGLTQPALADRLDVSVSALGKIEADERTPLLGHVVAWVTTCGFTFDLSRAIRRPDGAPMDFAHSPEAIAAADILDAATPEERAYLLGALRRLAKGAP